MRRAIQVADPSEPAPADEEFVASVLLPHELRLFAEGSASDRRHGVAVARRVQQVEDDPRWLRAALLHDAGKVRSALGVIGRSLVTAATIATPVAAARLEEHALLAESGNRLLDPVRRSLRPGAYLAHGPLGAAWLAAHGTEEEVASWVRIHHRRDLWPEAPIPAPLIRALALADESGP